MPPALTIIGSMMTAAIVSPMSAAASAIASASFHATRELSSSVALELTSTGGARDAVPSVRISTLSSHPW